MSAGLSPRLPIRFEQAEEPAPGASVIAFSGLPGVGKSTLADEVGRALAIPVFAIDWMLGALTPFGGRSMPNLIEVGDELLTTAAYRQLRLGQSAILDAPVESTTTRSRWRSMADAFNAAFKVVVCTCSDDAEHRRRLECRRRGIAGWHESGSWANVTARKAAFAAWDPDVDDVLVVDTIATTDDLREQVLRFVAS